MLLSTQTSLMTARLGYEEGVLALKRAGYDALDFSLFSMTRNDSPYVTEGWREYVEAQRRFADANGIVFNQSHAPFSFRWDDATVREEIAQPRVLRSLEIAAMMGVKAIVVHPLHYCEYLGHEKEMHELNLEYYRSMIPYCREYGIQVAVENMWQNERRRRIISYVCSVTTVSVRFMFTTTTTARTLTPFPASVLWTGTAFVPLCTT